ncbi:MAG: tRNA (5-methylaminomethyl-2-thiouridine)(34)-methyltransferase MnmD [Burkholderiaceae bacterium]|jgi:tRNA 5-methylaminomethyl-2-thiouridine biosynthesis bifunctional protein|nr:tRNA (5-methylaminomethyl-2-thiouridine)(34)-methyltransferase MnmD [Burkholderiaceae bacterium]
MSEPIDWLPDGTPYSPRFGDRYHSELGGLDQARHVFLGGCGLPAAWADAPQWRILETGFGFGLNFLAAWAAWKVDPRRPRLLHFVSAEAFPVSADALRQAMPHDPVLRPLAEELVLQFQGLLPGVHRLAFEQGRVLLTLYIGDAQAMLRRQQITADSIYLDGFTPALNPELWSGDTIRALARHCRRGTQLSTWCVARTVRDALSQNGFQVRKVDGVPPKRHNLHAVYDPAWQLRGPRAQAAQAAVPQRCLVLGAGLAGAAAAASLSRRGWQVTVLDAGEAPAAGASALPAGLFCPHVSPDDSLLSRLSRDGVRMVLGQLRTLSRQGLLQEGKDWAATGVLEHGIEAAPRLPRDWQSPGPGTYWSRPASADQLSAAGLPAGAPACWHVQAGWVRPWRLVQAQLALHGVHWQGRAHVARLVRTDTDTTWQALDAAGRPLAEAELVVLALGPATNALLESSLGPEAGWPLQALRGQVSWDRHDDTSLAAMPPFPVNGHGNLVPATPQACEGLPTWVMGSTFERDQTALPPSPEEQAEAHAANGAKLSRLLPRAYAGLRGFFDAPPRPTWSAVRVASPDRLPVVGPVARAPGLWALTGLGSRGLTLSLLCGELLAARLHDEPWPLDARLAAALASERLDRRR